MKTVQKPARTVAAERQNALNAALLPLSVAAFLRDWVVVGDRYGRAVRASELFLAYLIWCRRARTGPVTQAMFGRRLAAAGASKAQSGTHHYRGMALTMEAAAALRATIQAHKRREAA